MVDKMNNIKSQTNDEKNGADENHHALANCEYFLNSYDSEFRSSGFILTGVMGLLFCSAISSLCQLEKLYAVEGRAPILNIPYLIEMTYDESMYLCISSFLAVSIFIAYQRNLLLRATLKMPMVPSYWPFFGTAFEFLTNSPWDLMEEWHRSYGPIYSFKLLGRTCIAIENPEYLREVLQKKIQHVKKDVNFAYKPFLPILGTGIVTSEGKSWMKQRLKISTALKVDVLEIIPRVTLEAVRRLMVKMDDCAETGSTIDIGEELRHLTLQVISETFLSISAEESDATFATMYLPIVDESNKRVWRPERAYFFFMPFFWRHIFGVRRLNSYVTKLITERWASRNEETAKDETSKKEDILDLVLNHYEKENPGEEITSDAVRQIRDEFKTFMLAGHETSAAMMTWALYELMKNKKLMDQVATEAESVFGKFNWKENTKAIPSKEELTQLISSESCLKEALRKYSVVPTVARRITSPLQVGPHSLPKGSTVMISIQSVHHNPAFWQNPMEFDPSRFSTHPSPYTFLPFVEGPRNCLGQYLALLESKIVISLLTQRYHMRLLDEEDCMDPRHRYIVPIIPKGRVDVSVLKKDFNVQ